MKVGLRSAADASRFASAWSDLAGVGRDHAARRVLPARLRRRRDAAAAVVHRAGAAPRASRSRTTATATSGPGGARPAPDAVVTGSHLDSVPGGGAFDGPLGVVSALLAVDELRLRGVAPARPLAIACFAEEEGGRFGVPCLGSRLLTGADRRRPGAPAARPGRRVGRRRRPPGRVRPVRHGRRTRRGWPAIGTFVELHVEQGRLLQAADPTAVVGIGSEIVAHGRWRITVTGQGNHAGTTRPADRHDPMIPAAAAVLAARREITRHDGAVATVGRISPIPGGTNVIASVRAALAGRPARLRAGHRRRWSTRSSPRSGRRPPRRAAP